MAGRVRVGIVGLGFGAEFIPIYQRHPDADMSAICQRNPESLKKVGDAFKIEKRYTDYEDLLKDPNIDAVHINSPIPDHAPHDHRRPQGGQARDVHRAHGHHRRGLQADRRARQEDRPQLHDGGDGRLRPRVPLREGAVREGRARQDPVPAGQPSAGHGRLAELLARPAPDALRHPLRGPVPRPDRGTTPNTCPASAPAPSARS